MDAPSPAPAPPTCQRRGRGGTLDHSLVGPPSGLLPPQQALRLDHSLAAPAGWLAHAAAVGAEAARDTAAEAALDLLVVVVDETCALPRLSGAPAFRGRLHDMRGVSPSLSGSELVAQCVEGVPVVSRARGGKGRWCLCWSEAVKPDKHSDHELGAPGARIEVIEEPSAGASGGLARVLENWTLAEAGIETDDVLWCRYLILRS